MSLAAESLARLQVSLREIVEFFDKNGIDQHSVEKLNDFIAKSLTFDFLELCESFGECMAFIDHDELCRKLLSSLSLLTDCYTIERKNLNKRLKFLKVC